MMKSVRTSFFLFTGMLLLLAMPFQVFAQEDASTSDAEKLQKRLEAVTEVPNQKELIDVGKTTDSKGQTVPGGGVIFQGVTKQCWLAGTCSICDMLVVVVNISNAILRVFAIIGVMMLVYGSAFIALSSGNTSHVDRGKKIMRAAIIGGLIVLGSWQFMNIFVTALYNTSVAKQDGTQSIGYNPVTSWYEAVGICRDGIASDAKVTSGPAVTDSESKPVRVPR